MIVTTETASHAASPAAGPQQRAKQPVIAQRRAMSVSPAAKRGMIVLTLVFAGLFAVAATAGAETRVALVIGNATYPTNRLKNPRNDALLMSRTLSEAGFEVMTVMDGTGNEMRHAIEDFGARLQTPDTVALFYYAGHGVQVDSENYLIPLDASIASSDDVIRNAVPLQSVMRAIERSKTRLNIVILDACRDNPFVGNGWTATVSGLASVVAPAGTIIAYSTGPGEIADDGRDSNSPYTAALTSEMTRPGAALDDIFRRTRLQVLERTNRRQTPWEHSSLTTEFAFIAKPAVTVETTVSDEQLAELKAWEAIKDSDDALVIKTYLDTYPNGLFAELANLRLAKIKTALTRTPWSFNIAGAVEPAEKLRAALSTYQKAEKLDVDAAADDDLAVVAKLYAEAAAEGLPAAMYRLGRAYDKGRGISRDQVLAARWYASASDAGYPAAMAALGTMHEFGDGTALNLAEALRLYRLAADAGDASALTSLGYLYSQGKGVARSTQEARKLYRRAVERGDPRAMFNLALMAIAGEGGAKDVAMALGLLDKAAKLGHARAYVELAHLYDVGNGVPRDSERAAANALLALKSAGEERQRLDLTSFHWSFATRRAIQRKLTEEGLYAGLAHGIFNRATRKALTAVAHQD